MNIHNTDFGFIGLSAARIASQLRKGINLNMTTSFGTELGTYVIISLFDGDKFLQTFHLTQCDAPRDMMDKIFAYCMDNDLFKVPLNLTIVD